MPRTLENACLGVVALVSGLLAGEAPVKPEGYVERELNPHIVERGNAYRAVELIVDAPHKTPAGDPIDATITIVNRGNIPVNIEASNVFYFGSLRVGSDKLSTPPLTPFGKKQFPMQPPAGFSLRSQRIAPGHARRVTVRVANVWELSEQRPYQFSAAWVVTFPASDRNEEDERVRLVDECWFEVVGPETVKVTTLPAKDVPKAATRPAVKF